MNDLEHRTQCAVVGYAQIKAKTEPLWGMLFAIPNGGDRDPRVGAKLKQEGVRRGVPDLCLPVPNGVFNGLYIEMNLGVCGFRVEVCHSHQAAIDTLNDYLSLISKSVLCQITSSLKPWPLPTKAKRKRSSRKGSAKSLKR